MLDRFREAAQLAGDFARSVRLNWAAKNILNSIGAWMERDESKFENDLAACRTALSESEFATAMEQGRGLTMEQAIVYAMDDQRH